MRPPYDPRIDDIDFEPKLSYTFWGQRADVENKLDGTSLKWLADVDYPNWEEAYRWLTTASLQEILDFAPVIESEHWNGHIPELK